MFGIFSNLIFGKVLRSYASYLHSHILLLKALKIQSNQDFLEFKVSINTDFTQNYPWKKINIENRIINSLRIHRRNMFLKSSQ